MEFKVFTEGHRDSETFRVYPDAGKKFTQHGIELQKETLLSGLMDQFPGRRFTAIPVAFNKFNIVHEVGEA